MQNDTGRGVQVDVNFDVEVSRQIYLTSGHDRHSGKNRTRVWVVVEAIAFC